MQNKTFLIRQIIGANVREGRKRLGLTQEQFAEVLGISVQSISSMENGTQFSRMDTYCKVSELLAIPLYSVFIPQQESTDDLDMQIRLLFIDCDADEKMALTKIIGIIKTLVHLKGNI